MHVRTYVATCLLASDPEKWKDLHNRIPKQQTQRGTRSLPGWQGQTTKGGGEENVYMTILQSKSTVDDITTVRHSQLTAGEHAKSQGQMGTTAPKSDSVGSNRHRRPLIGLCPTWAITIESCSTLPRYFHRISEAPPTTRDQHEKAIINNLPCPRCEEGILWNKSGGSAGPPVTCNVCDTHMTSTEETLVKKIAPLVPR